MLMDYGAAKETAWYALRVTPQREYVAAFHLSQRGIETFVPTETRWRWANRYARSRKAKREVEFPVMPHYVFAGFAGPVPWLHVFETPFVHSVVGHSGQPWQLKGKDWDGFKAAHRNGFLRAPVEQRFMQSHKEFGVGDTVNIMSGAFRLTVAQVTSITGPIAKVMLPLFNDMREVPIPVDALEKIA